jgi:hypothetical protein
LATDSEGSLLDLNRKVRHFGEAAFIAIAQNPSRCFLCGIDASAAQFNDEHVIPDWLLRRFALHRRTITLPNCTTLPYGQYKLRCCQTCNSLLGQEVEERISALLGDNIADFASGLSQTSNCLLYQWLCLLFIKTHLKDRDLRADRDRRSPSPQLSTLYEWRRLHHIHSVARAAVSGVSIDPAVQGTILVFEMNTSDEPFDYGDIYDHSTVVLRVGRIGVVAVLNDCGATGLILDEFLSGIDAPLVDIQLREIAARAAYGNELLVSRPTFRTELHAERDLLMKCNHPETPQYGEADKLALGALLDHSCADRIRQSLTPNKEEMLSRLSKGELTFLYDDAGDFLTQVQWASVNLP